MEMRLDVVLRYIGVVMLFIATFMLLSAGISYFNGMDSAFYPLLLSALLTTLLGIFPLIFVERQEQLTTKEGFCIVVGAWLLACVVGSFPYLIWGGEFSVINAWFESVSGFTTTGATVLNDIESLPRGMLFWRMSTTWIGGIGVVMFALVILPSMGRNKLTLTNVELSTLAKDNYRYRTQVIVRILLAVYVGLMIISMLLLKLAGMNWFDALCHAMSVCATSGFSTKNASIAYFNSPAIDWVLIFSMMMAGVHFGLIFATVTGKRNNLFRSEVARWYFGMLLLGGLLITVSVFAADLYPTFFTAFRGGLFQFVSLMTTTGFATADTNQWTSFAIVILLFGSLVCACAGSTTGGLKINRLILSLKMIRARLSQQQHPNAIIRIRLDGAIQDTESLHSVTVFIVTYLLLILVGTVFGTMLGIDLMTSFSGSIASIGNVGPGFGEVGSMNNFSALPAAFKLSNSLLMLFGRLEIFGLIQLFFIKWWR
jgi:trk system potassium uptake protein TrkH